MLLRHVITHAFAMKEAHIFDHRRQHPKERGGHFRHRGINKGLPIVGIVNRGRFIVLATQGWLINTWMLAIRPSRTVKMSSPCTSPESFCGP